MHKLFYSKRAQSYIEYGLIIAIISAAFIAMSTYMRRSMNARLKQIQMEMDESKR